MSDRSSQQGPRSGLFLKWTRARARFLLWLPWFILAFPWHIRKAHRQVRYWVDYRQPADKTAHKHDRDID